MAPQILMNPFSAGIEQNGCGEMIFKSAEKDFRGRAPLAELKDFDFYEKYKKSQKKRLAAHKKEKEAGFAKGLPTKSDILKNGVGILLAFVAYRLFFT